MSHPQQEFTFVNVAAGRKQNTRTIKRHVSKQTNRRKRQEAVRKYQKSLLEADEPSTSNSHVSSSHSHRYDESSCSSCLTSESSGSTTFVKDDIPPEDEVQRSVTPRRGATARQPFQIVDYWPTYQRWLAHHLSLNRQPEPDDDEDRMKKLKKLRKVAHSPSQSYIWMSISPEHITIHIPRIDSPADQHRMEWGFRLCRDFIGTEYESTWKSEWQPVQWFQGSLIPLGIWRECFPMAVEFIRAGKLQQAFFLLNSAFNVTPTFFKQNHPALLIACLGSMMWTCQIEDQKLATLIRSHITQLSMAHLGPRHPISMILREQMRVVEAAHGTTDLLSIVVMDMIADVFGHGHVLPLSMRWGYVRRQYASGDFAAARESLTKLERYWNADTMPAGQIPKFLAFEKAKVDKAQQEATNKDAPETTDLREVAESSIQLPVFIPGKGPDLAVTDSVILMNLGKHLLMNSHYALALYIYAHIHQVFAPLDIDEPLTPNQDPESLPATVARILVDHLRGEQNSLPEKAEDIATGSTN